MRTRQRCQDRFSALRQPSVISEGLATCKRSTQRLASCAIREANDMCHRASHREESTMLPGHQRSKLGTSLQMRSEGVPEEFIYRP